MAAAAILKTRKKKKLFNFRFLFIFSRAVFRGESNSVIEIYISKIERDRDDFMAEIATNSVLHVYWVS